MVKYTALAICVYFLFLYGRTEQTDDTDRGSTGRYLWVFFLKQIFNIPVRRQDIQASREESSMSTTLATTTSAMFYSDEEEEMEEPIGANMTELDVRKETEAFLEENKLRKANIRF